MSGRLTTHVLDTTHGCPAAGMRLALTAIHGDHSHHVMSGVTNKDGRCDAPLLEGDAMVAGTFELIFDVGTYFEGLDVAGSDAFLGLVPIRFIITDEDAHYHVPLLVSPFGYSTYRGS